MTFQLVCFISILAKYTENWDMMQSIFVVGLQFRLLDKYKLYLKPHIVLVTFPVMLTELS